MPEITAENISLQRGSLQPGNQDQLCALRHQLDSVLNGLRPPREVSSGHFDRFTVLMGDCRVYVVRKQSAPGPHSEVSRLLPVGKVGQIGESVEIPAGKMRFMSLTIENSHSLLRPIGRRFDPIPHGRLIVCDQDVAKTIVVRQEK